MANPKCGSIFFSMIFMAIPSDIFLSIFHLLYKKFAISHFLIHIFFTYRSSIFSMCTLLGVSMFQTPLDHCVVFLSDSSHSHFSNHCCRGSRLNQFFHSLLWLLHFFHFAVSDLSNAFQNISLFYSFSPSYSYSFTYWRVWYILCELIVYSAYLCCRWMSNIFMHNQITLASWCHEYRLITVML